jgi:hypothetical protein
MTDLQLARGDLARIEARRCAGIPWFVVGGFILASAAGVLNVACGVVIAAVTALAWGWSCLVERRRAHSEIVAARANVARWEGILEGERLRGELFTESEARRGERDEASGRGGVVTRFERRSR